MFKLNGKALGFHLDSFTEQLLNLALVAGVLKNL